MRGYAAIAMVLIMSHHSKRLIIMDSVVSNCFYFIFSPPITALADPTKTDDESPCGKFRNV